METSAKIGIGKLFMELFSKCIRRKFKVTTNFRIQQLHSDISFENSEN